MKVDLSRKAMMMRLLYIVAGFIMFKVYRESYPKGTNDRNEKNSVLVNTNNCNLIYV